MNTTNPKTLYNEVVEHLEIEFSDYAFRKPLLEKQINKIGYRQSKEYNFVVLEIKQFFKTKLFFKTRPHSHKIETEPTYTGNCYKTIIVSLMNKRIQKNILTELEEQLKHVEQYDFNKESAKNTANNLIFETGKHKIQAKYNAIKASEDSLNYEKYKKELEELKTKQLTEIEYKVYTEDLRSQMVEGIQKRLKIETQHKKQRIVDYNYSILIPKYDLFQKWFNYQHHNYTKEGRHINTEKSENYLFGETFLFIYGGKSNTIKWVEEQRKTRVVRIRVVDSNIDYQATVQSFYNARNLKYWDKTTGKTNNKGLKATHYRTYHYDTDRPCGWKFGGITADDMKEFCRTNGYKTGTVKDVKTFTKLYKTHTYGDMANWILKTLE